MGKWRADALFTIPLVLSWLAGALFPYIVGVLDLDLYSRGPWLPLVAYYRNESANGSQSSGHVASSLYYFMIVLAAAILCALVLEVAKPASARYKRGSLLYAALLLQQMLIAADVIRTHAWDWWLFLLSVGGFRQVDEWSWMERHFTLTGRWPWPSAISGLFVAGTFLMVRRAGERRC